MPEFPETGSTGIHDDPYELWLEGMDDYEPEPGIIEGLPAADALTPSDRYLELFEHVQNAHIFPDSKTFADCSPKGDPLDILILYRKLRRSGKKFDLADFVAEHFTPPSDHGVYHHQQTDKPISQHIDDLWPVLVREPRQHQPFSSLLPLPKPYLVPGGRFGEVYYWDSYFTMLGLPVSGRTDLLRDMADNFAWLIENYGHIPNGNRTYYLSRSQPPVFALMVELFEEAGLPGSTHYLQHLIREHEYWMDGAGALLPHQAYRHVVRMPDGSLLNRYWDDRDTPRDESWREDIATAKFSGRPPGEVYRDLRAGAASGWDYSSRWLRDPNRLASIRTTQFIPVDLNALLYKLETTIVRLAEDEGEILTSRAWQLKADARRKAMDRYLWDDIDGVYRDYDWRRSTFGSFSAAAAVPLFTGMASPAQAKRVSAELRRLLLTKGGLVSSTIDSGEQWDKPNGWAPLQWMAIEGLNAYGETALARDIAVNWLTTVTHFYSQHHKLVEKYDISSEHSRPGGGGEYPLQDGFGWTNGVTRKLMTVYGRFLPKG
ncbi:alpha,alpha-trehalase TreF [Tatumella sp. JGM118]|uniref:alpha,alpha-trehalase TreF n=1 Tax=Tatumella sp. JGM118 TaxID=2799796 RepID=UPI003530438E